VPVPLSDGSQGGKPARIVNNRKGRHNVSIDSIVRILVSAATICANTYADDIPVTPTVVDSVFPLGVLQINPHRFQHEKQVRKQNGRVDPKNPLSGSK